MKRALQPDEKKAEVGIDLPQPQMDERAATLTTREKITLGADSLQRKMITAAKEIVRLECDKSVTWQEYQEAVEKRVFCTPETVLFLLGKEWIKLTEESLVYVGIDRGTAAKLILEYRLSCRQNNRVSWVLPRIDRHEGGTR